MAVAETVPTALHRGEAELPFVDLGDGMWLLDDGDSAIASLTKHVRVFP